MDKKICENCTLTGDAIKTCSLADDSLEQCVGGSRLCLFSGPPTKPDPNKDEDKDDNS